ncbi:MAG TPA: class I SAM-dependent methyltransferase [Longimicrobiales bacterium]|nr:class I SAM-dependent methyltransferase [Longimicrobiales bacterium]
MLAPFHPEEEARFEVGALRELLALSQDERVLDVGCGWGRHLTLLRRAGHLATGLDLSPPLLRQARRDDDAAPLVAGDMRHIPFRDAAFDVVLNLASSLGLFLDDESALAALRDMRRVLRPGGRLLLEGMHRDDVVAGYAERDAWELEDGTRVRARRRFDAVRGVSHEVLRWNGALGRGGSRHSLRLRTATELVALVTGAGLHAVDLWGDWNQEPFTRASPRLILLAGRA